MKALGRRAMLKVLGIGAAAPALAPAAIVPGGVPVSAAFGWASGALGFTSNLPSGGSSVLPGSPLDLILRAAQKAYYAESRRQDWRRAYRIGGFDHDIYALQSIPLATKVRMQMARDEKPKSILEQLHSKAWPQD